MGDLLLDLLSSWLSGSFGKGSFTTYLTSVRGGAPVERPAVVKASLRDAYAAITPLLNVRDDEAIRAHRADRHALFPVPSAAQDPPSARIWRNG